MIFLLCCQSQGTQVWESKPGVIPFFFFLSLTKKLCYVGKVTQPLWASLSHVATLPARKARKPSRGGLLKMRVLVKSLQDLLQSMSCFQLYLLQFFRNSWKKVLEWLSFESAALCGDLNILGVFFKLISKDLISFSRPRF